MPEGAEAAANQHCNTPDPPHRCWRVREAERLERFLADQLPDASRGAIRKELGLGAATVDGVVRHLGYRLRGGEEVIWSPAAPLPTVPAESGPLEVLYEDDLYIAVNKQSGMLSHPTAQVRTGTVLNRLLGLGHREVHLLHRLDRGTSGVLLAAKRRTSGSAIFTRGEVRKRYLAVVAPGVSWRRRLVDLPVGRVRGRAPAWNVDPNGASARTRLGVLARLQRATLLEAVPLTGRTNQIRIHCAAIGLPLAGDTPYGGAAASRLYLHAWTLAFFLPDGTPQTIHAPPPCGFLSELPADVMFSRAWPME